MRKDSLYARRDYNLDSGVGPSAFDATDGHLHTPSRLGGTGPELAMAATAAATPELIVERDGWGTWCISGMISRATGLTATAGACMVTGVHSGTVNGC